MATVACFLVLQLEVAFFNRDRSFYIQRLAGYHLTERKFKCFHGFLCEVLLYEVVGIDQVVFFHTSGVDGVSGDHMHEVMVNELLGELADGASVFAG